MTTVNLSQQALDELVTRLKIEIRLIVHEELRDALHKQSLKENTVSRPPLNLPVLNVGSWPEELGGLRREEMYGDDGR